MNPVTYPSKDISSYFISLKNMYPKAYDKHKTSPFTKVRIILMNGTEFESNWFLHQFARNCTDQDLRRQLAIVRAQEQQQQKRISCLKPINENMLETTISYEQLAIELTAILAQNVKCKNTRAALDFALLEDFDHLYRFSNLLKMDYNIDASNIVGIYTEIMPARPTIAHHRHPIDNIRAHMIAKKADLYTQLVGGIITAAEQQTMNFYMNMAQMYKNNLGRKLFSEIGLVEEEHVSQYESLKDPNCTWLEQWVMHEYTECYLYYSMQEDESDPYVKEIWQEHFEMEVAHLKLAIQMLEKYENKEVKCVLPKQEFPILLKFGENIDYIRNVIKTANLTSVLEDYISIEKLPNDARFFEYNTFLTGSEDEAPSHEVIEKYIAKNKKDYRVETKPHPLEELQNRKKDNTTLGRCKASKK